MDEIDRDASRVLWTGIVAYAVVAAITALVVEYLAKPSLDARKEEDYRRSPAATRCNQQPAPARGDLLLAKVVAVVT